MAYEKYFVPTKSHWPIIGAVGIGLTLFGAANLIHGKAWGPYVFLLGALIVAYMLYGWFRDVIHESMQGLYSKQMSLSFRHGMLWFIFSEIMFFVAFFGMLFYVRHLSVPWLGGLGHKVSTHEFLWPHFQATWPLLTNPDPALFPGPKEAMGAWGLPAINTLILLTSGATLTFAHWGLQKNQRVKLALGLLFTILLGITFLSLQVLEYQHAYHEMHLTLNSGIYGSTFFMLTGFHGAHVTIGTIMLFIAWIRCLKGHFSPNEHFAFEATAWYWHFVDVVWLVLFIFVYWL